MGAQSEPADLTRVFNLVPWKMNPVYVLHKVNQCMESGNLFQKHTPDGKHFFKCWYFSMFVHEIEPKNWKTANYVKLKSAKVFQLKHISECSLEIIFHLLQLWLHTTLPCALNLWIKYRESIWTLFSEESM